VIQLSCYPSMDYVDLIQWPAMVLTAIAAWLVGSQRRTKRGVGFWLFLLSNVLWTLWGWHARAYALIVLQICLAAINIRGAQKNDPVLSSSSGA
jgi:hypothetical protein